MSFDLKSVIGAVAPTLATMLGGPLAGTAVSALANAFGLPDGATQDDITRVVQSGNVTPDIIAKIREADQKHQEIIAQQGIDLKKLNMAHEEALDATAEADRASARDRETKVGDKTARNLAYVVVIGGAAMIGCTLAGYAKVDSVLAGTLIGYAVSEMKQVLNYYFGTSASSDRKTDIISQLPPLQASQTPAAK